MSPASNVTPSSWLRCSVRSGGSGGTGRLSPANASATWIVPSAPRATVDANAVPIGEVANVHASRRIRTPSNVVAITAPESVTT